MNKHPLTDTVCRGLCDQGTFRRRSLSRFLFDNMRRAYDMGAQAGNNEQLDKVLEWLNKNLENYSDNDVLVINGDCEFTYQLREDLEEAMRPQEDN